MEMSESIAALSAALSKAQMIMEGAIKGKVNPAFKSRYADLSSVWDACREPLASNGLSVIQMPGRVEGGQMSLTTQINHASGEWIRETMTIPLTKNDAQGYGSATSYARRYALAAFVGVSPDDDDGNGAVRGSTPANDSSPVKAISDAQYAQLTTLAEHSGADLKGFCAYFKTDAVKNLAADQFERAKAMLEKKLAEKMEVAA